jgi:hypothetical protein
MKMHECRISRRGKAAKGTIVVQTYGVPILNEDGIAKAWDYSAYAGKDVYELAASLDGVGDLAIALVQGLDMGNKSEAMKAQNESILLTSRVFLAGLAETRQDAKNVAIAIIAARAQMAKLGVPVEAIPTIEFLMEQRKKLVDKLKATGNFSAPRLVDNRPKESVEDDSTEDSDDEDSEEVSE